MRRASWLIVVLSASLWTLTADAWAAGVGRGNSVAIGSDGLGLISYSDGVSHDLKVAHCSNLACTSATLSTLDTDGVGNTAIVIGADGLGLIAYYSSGSLKVAHCSDVLCTSAVLTTLESGITPGGSSPEIAVGGDGLAVVVYQTSFSIRVAHCTDVLCSGATVGSFDGTISTHLSMARLTTGADGLPLIAWNRSVFSTETFQYLDVAHCGDATCASPTVSVVPLTFAPLAITRGQDGLGLIVAQGGASGGRAVHCSNAACTASTSADLIPMSDASVATGADGVGLIAIGDAQFGAVPHDLRVAHCADVTCSSAAVATLDAASTVWDVDLAIGSDGLGLISYYDGPAGPGTVGSLKVAHCLDVACSSAALSTLEVAPPHTDLALVVSASPDPVPTLQTLTYNLRLFNQGPLQPSQVTVEQVLPAAVTFQSAAGPGWSCGEAGGVVTCTGPAPAVFGSSTILVTVTAPVVPQTLSSTITASSGIADQTPANNSQVVETVVRLREVELVALKSDGGAVARWGQPFTWTITMRNDGFDEAAGALAMDTFPAGVTGVTWTCVASAGSSCPASGTGDLNVPVTLVTGGLATFTATGTVGAGTLSLVNTAAAGVPLGAIDRFPDNNTATTISAVEPARAYVVTPCRLVDTRGAQSPALDANSTRTFAVAGLCGVPADARAVAVNVVAVNPGDLGNLRLYPAGAPLPLASALNFAAGATRANNAIVPLGTAGQVTVRCDMAPGSTATTHFVMDVFAFFRGE